MKIQIKNMVCPRCISAVAEVIKVCKLEALSVELGEVALAGNPAKAQLEALQTGLQAIGFAILEDPRSQVVARIKAAIVKRVHYSEDLPAEKLSELLSAELLQDYSALSNLFSAEEGITIEKYLIAQRIERAKELLLYGELNLTQIADKLGYSSVAYLSNQFKKVVGKTPTAFRQQAPAGRQSIDAIGEK